ncbi:MAG: serine hydrolase, partial [Actinobacteria bacterium]|nr:serine hydrolase [Actinomycetota bacterium]
KNTSMPDTPEISGAYSMGYVDKGGNLENFTELNPMVAWTGGGMVSDLEDMKTWARALANGELLGKEMHEEQMNWVDTGAGTMKYGLGVVNANGFLGHHGAIFGYNSVFFYLPEEDATIVVFTNKSTNESGESSDIFMRLVKILFPERITR